MIGIRCRDAHLDVELELVVQRPRLCKTVVTSVVDSQEPLVAERLDRDSVRSDTMKNHASADLALAVFSLKQLYAFRDLRPMQVLEIELVRRAQQNRGQEREVVRVGAGDDVF